MNNHLTPIKWMGKNIYQEHILRYLDRENPVGEIVSIAPFGGCGLIVRDAYCVEHYFICQEDGTVRCLDEEEEAEPA